MTTIPVTATLMGHPWDLWGLSVLFDGSDASHTLLKAAKPAGRPTFDTNDPAAVQRFRVHGYDVFATLTADELVWDEDKGRVDLRDLAPVAKDILARINGVAILFDLQYRAAKLLNLTYDTGTSVGTVLNNDWTPNRNSTPLGAQQEHRPFAHAALSLANTNGAVRLVLDAMALPRTWASMYLIYEAIAGDVGSVQELDKRGFVPENDLRDFRKAANNNRSLQEGMRHASKPNPGPLITFDRAYFIINTLAVRWLQSMMKP
jgi:hypothetical protein